ncbi:MAG: leucine-rich repeat protein [Muribaculaceae bacterium]|nr:leucine-rich repeat protein [Muribaculaceae bacterium]
MKRIKLLLVLMATVLSSLSSMAHNFEVDGIYYNISDTPNEAYVTYKGASSAGFSDEYTGDIVIPERVTYNDIIYSVTSIESSAFCFCRSLTSVEIPSSVTSIGGSAFRDCSSLTSVEIPNSVTSIEQQAFYNCSSLTSVNIPNSVTDLGSFAFYGCSSLSSVTLGNSVQSIGGKAFYRCSGLTSATICCSSATEIGDDAFYGCSAPITILSDVPPTVTTTSFASGTTIYVPETAKQNYLNASNWNRYNIIGCQILDINSGVSLTGTVAFSGSGSGTENDPFLIFNPVQLNDVRNSVGYSGIYYKLMSDIDMTEWIAENNPSQGWQPIGNASSMFKGIFIGNGKKITGLTINRSTTDYAGLFGYVYNASISDLTVEGEVNGNNYTGGLIGKANSSTITNCHFNGNVTGNSNTGGITGLLYNSVLKSSNHNGTVAGNAEFTGGIIGEMIWACVDSCQQTGNVTGNGDYTGGICGKAEVYSSDISLTEGTFTYSANDNNTISNVTAYGDIIGQSHTGGISGAILNRYKTNTTVTLSNCSHEGVISGVKYVSGVVGYNQIENSTNSTTFNYCQHKGKITAQSHIGGIIGYDTQSGSGTIEITNCNLKGDLTATAGGAIGGIIGYASSSGNRNISNCYALSMIQAKEDYAGGIAGQIEGGNNTISDCYFSGNINANQYIGGLCGKASATTIKYSYSNTSLLNGVSYVGGIAGYADANSSIYSCVSADEKINATNNYVGRIYGDVAQGATIGEMGTTTENKALATATVNLNGVQQNLADGAQHGTNVGRSTLRLRSTYQGIGWDFASNWANQETESYPYKPAQTAPPVIQCTTTSGGTTISGKGMTDATIYVSIGKHMYSTKVSDNQWNLTVDPMQSGALITVYAEAPGLDESYRVYQLVNYIGNGTADDPYQIYTADDLANINGLGYYKIMNDIDLTEWIDTNNPTQGWLPIGRNGNVMSNLIGDNHKISGLWIDSEDDYVALMAMADNITITDLTVETDTTKGVNGGSFSGIIIGKAINGRIINCRANGIVKSTGDYVAGIVGYSSGVLFNECSAKVNITGNKYLGGITGIANDSIATCQSSATITGANYIGGLVGKTSSPIINCFAIDSITGVNNTADTCYTGGLAGFSSANISLSYSKGYISQESTGTECYAGGIVGYNDGAAVSNCYSTAKTSSSQYAAGIAGYNTGTIDKCYA